MSPALLPPRYGNSRFLQLAPGVAIALFAFQHSYDLLFSVGCQQVADASPVSVIVLTVSQLEIIVWLARCWMIQLCLRPMWKEKMTAHQSQVRHMRTI